MGRWAILNGLLIVIALLLTLEIARTWGRSLPPVETGARGADPAPKGDGAENGKGGDAKAGRRDRGGKRGGANEKVAVQPATLVATIVDKDLFDPSRQKASEEVKPPPPKETAPPPGLTVVGIRMLGDRDSEAFITDASQANQQRRLRVGDQVGGYTLKTIQPSRVTLASATGDTITLSLAVDKSGGGAPRPGGPPRPGQPAAANAGSPAAGVQPQAPVAAGVQPPRGPRGAVPGRPGAPGMPAAPGTPPAAPGVPPSPAAGPNFGQPQMGAAPPATTPPVPNIPAAVREKLEQLKGN